MLESLLESKYIHSNTLLSPESGIFEKWDVLKKDVSSLHVEAGNTN